MKKEFAFVILLLMTSMGFSSYNTTTSCNTTYDGNYTVITCLSNVNSTNASAYIWLKMDCDGATPGTYNSFSYDFIEQ